MGLESPILEKAYTVEEYFELEKHSEIRHEYYYGKLLLMHVREQNIYRYPDFVIDPRVDDSDSQVLGAKLAFSDIYDEVDFPA